MKTDYRHEAVSLGWPREKILEIDTHVIGRYRNFANRQLVSVNESTILYDNVDRCQEWRRSDVPFVPLPVLRYRASLTTRPTAAFTETGGYQGRRRQSKPQKRERMDELGGRRRRLATHPLQRNLVK